MIDVVNVDVGFILSLACVYDTDFYDRLLMATICPAFVLGLLGCTYLVARRRNRQSEQVVFDLPPWTFVCKRVGVAGFAVNCVMFSGGRGGAQRGRQEQGE